LSDSYQSGVNWSAFKNGINSHVSAGVGSPGATLAPGTLGVANPLANAALAATPGATLLPAAVGAGSLFGLAFQTNNFAVLLNFLESQGDVHVLSSPRIATLNNQKAVLKVGTDEFFVTEISGGTQGTTAIAGTSPTVKMQPFFSGIALDVTPRIDANNEIILHVHPSVSAVTTVNKTLNLGTGTAGMGSYTLPMASSSVSETDSIVRARDGQIVAIGGLMRQDSTNGESGLPGLSKSVFGQTSKVSNKRELVILIKPTVVDTDRDWSEDIARSRDRVDNLSRQVKP
jgi:MSHA biogenesis protein MshL